MQIIKVHGTPWVISMDAQRHIRWMDAEVFPDDKPVTFHGSYWFIAYDPWSCYEPSINNPVAYAGWRPHYPMETLAELHWHEPVGFLYRAGVLPTARGKGLQKELIKVREEDIKNIYGIKKAITYTDTQSAASMRSLIACGYKPYVPNTTTNLAGVGRGAQFVHWEKTL